MYLNLAQYILPRLIKFKELNVNSFPCEFNNIEEWHNVIDKMIFAFDWLLFYHSKKAYVSVENYNKNESKYEEGINLFAKYFTDLWD